MYVTPKQMADIENISEKYGVKKADLMENAGGRICLFIAEEIFPYIDLSPGICILAGSGNNGGDGFTTAKNIAEMGLPVSVILVSGAPKTALAKAALNAVRDIPEITVIDRALDSAFNVLTSSALVIDCIFGTGYKPDGGKNARAAAFLDHLAKSPAVKIAVDIPSGGDAATGAYDFNVPYDYTLSLGYDKIGLMSEPLKRYAGKVKTLDIDIPEEAKPPVSAFIWYTMFQPETLFTKRQQSSHKGDFGKALIIAGSSRYSGAAYLAAKAALRSGAGLVTLASVKDVIDRVGSMLPEVTFLPLPADKNGVISPAGAKELARNIADFDFDVITFGCGITDSPAAADILEILLKKTTCTKIIDADGINALAGNINLLKENTTDGEIIITPHPAELGRLYGVQTAEAVKNRADYARSFAREYGVTVVAKGVPTFICTPDGGCNALFTGNPGLSKGGSGDVLSGIMTGLFSNRSKILAGIPSDNRSAVQKSITAAVTAAAGLHGAAADIAVKRYSEHAMLASDVIDAIPEVIKGC
jgi:NAD(P)H-hydrate epimerase